MKIRSAVVARVKDSKSHAAPSSANQFVMTVEFEVVTVADVQEVATLMRALGDKRQDIKIHVGF